MKNMNIKYYKEQCEYAEQYSLQKWSKDEPWPSVA
jgi:hypothetical protein